MKHCRKVCWTMTTYCILYNWVFPQWFFMLIRKFFFITLNSKQFTVLLCQFDMNWNQAIFFNVPLIINCIFQLLLWLKIMYEAHKNDTIEIICDFITHHGAVHDRIGKTQDLVGKMIRKWFELVVANW